MALDKIEALCNYCDGINEISGSELYSAIKAKPSGAQLGLNCMHCARINVLNIGLLPKTGKLTTSEWTSKTLEALGESWLPCVKWNGLEAKLPLGEYIEPGDLLSPRLWKYKNANLDKAPDNTVWWSWEAYAINYGFDAFLKLRLMRGADWEKAIFCDQKPHHRSRVFMIPINF
jgi:hypothetical protein